MHLSEFCLPCLNHQFPLFMDLLSQSSKYSAQINFRLCNHFRSPRLIRSSCLWSLGIYPLTNMELFSTYSWGKSGSGVYFKLGQKRPKKGIECHTHDKNLSVNRGIEHQIYVFFNKGINAHLPNSPIKSH